MENSCFYRIRYLGGPDSLKSAFFLQKQVLKRSIELKIGVCRWKTAVFMKSGVQEVQRAQNRPFWMENSCFYRIRYLGGPDSLKSAFFLQKQVLKRSIELKIGVCRWKTAVFTKSGVQEVHRAQNRLFQMENSCFNKIRCLGGPESSKSAILDGKQLFVKNQLSRRSRELKIGYFGWKTTVFIKSGV